MTNSKSTKLTALLLAGVLATSCFVGGTLARYVTSTSSEDSARVAVWGINADEVTMDLFDATYTVNGVTVAMSEDGDNIIAPGTEKDNYFSIVNLDDNLKPEVMYEVAINLDDSEIDPLILNNPSIVWRLDEGAYGTWEETKAQVLALSGDASGVKTYAPLEIAENFKASKTHKIGWKWIMDNNNNVMDTEMGNKAATDGDISAKIVIKVTATQVNVDTTGMLNGNGSVYNTNDPQPLVFRSSAPVDELQSVEVNGDELTQGTDYTVSSGSTVITLSDTYLASLETGNYTISIISDSMTARATFAVTEVEEAPANDPLVHNGVIPEGGVYYRGIDSIYNINEEADMFYSTTYPDIIETADEIFTENNNFPSTPQTGDVYVYGDYEYRYNYKLDDNWINLGYDNVFIEDTSLNGWGVYCTRQTTSPTEILTTINNKNVVNVDYLFYRRDINNPPTIPNTINSMIGTFQDSNITNTPVIPNSVTNLTSTFQDSNITNAPVIPNSVTNLTNTFANCENLTGILTINSNPTQYTDMLYNTNISNIQGSISNELKNEIRRTYDFMNPELIIPGETIPNGGIYYRGIQAVYDEDFGEDLYKHGDYTTATEIYTAGTVFPEPQIGDTFVYNGEEYRYGFSDWYNDYYGFIQWTENNSNEWDPSYIESHDNY